MKYPTLFLSLALSCSLSYADLSDPIKPGREITVPQAPACIACGSDQTGSGTIVNINPKTRTVKLKDNAGKVVTVQVSKQMPNFEQLKKGDRVAIITRTQSDIIVTRGALENKIRTNSESITRSRLSERSKFNQKQTSLDQAKIIDLDYKTQTVTFESMHGVYSLAANDPEQFTTLRVGDIVNAINTKTVEIALTAPTSL